MFSCKMFKKPSQENNSISKFNFHPIVKQLQVPYLELSSRISLLLFRILISLIASSFDKVGTMYTRSKIFASLSLASCSLETVTSGVLGFSFLR